ncbi:MAG: cation:proton antiporter [Planctomycetota bacterium]|nr:cation:proton antiporter [Planctomycetota bacterium]
MDEHAAILIQVATILGLSRFLSEAAKRLRQPTVLGELLAGMVLGPSLLGWIWPGGFEAVFSNRKTLDSLANIGLILLMLLTGLETDIRVMRNLGRAAFMSSAFGLLVPFGFGLGLGFALDDAYLPEAGRLVMSLFLATALSVSAMPVIAKILIDLGLMKRNFAVLALSAAVVDDTIGWVVLAAITGMASGESAMLGPLAVTIGCVAVFCTLAVVAFHPLLRWFLKRTDEFLHVPDGEMVVVVAITFLLAAATELMHVHAVFGAFIAGMIFRQCPTLNAEIIHKIESVTLAVFAPLFFGAIGLSVNLLSLTSVGLAAAVLAAAIFGKVLGCLVGGLLGRLGVWESVGLGLCMSARGSVGLVVAKIGLDQGILNEELFAVLVMMAVITTFLAPLTLKPIVPRIPVSEEERLRAKSTEGRFVPSGQLKILIPASGGPNARLGGHLAAHLCQGEGDRCTALYVATQKPSWWSAFKARARGKHTVDAETVFQTLREAAGKHVQHLSQRTAEVQESLSRTILAEAAKGYHFLVMGSSREGHPVYDPFVTSIVKGSPCHLVLVAGKEGEEAETLPLRRILIPINGSYVSDAAFDLAAAYATATGASLHVLYISESKNLNPLLPAAAHAPIGEHMQDILRVTLKEQFAERFPHPERLECHVREGESVTTALVEEAHRGNYDLVVLGAENKSLVERLYLGANIEATILDVPCAIALVIPKVSGKR